MAIKDAKVLDAQELYRLIAEFCTETGFAAPPAAADALPDARLRQRFAALCDAAGFVPRISQSDVLRRAGLKADEMIDVGVHRGTPFLYDAFPDAYFLLVDPQRRAESLLENPPARFKFINAALGAEAGTMMFNVSGPKSSLLEWNDNIGTTVRRRYEVSVTTLDALIGVELHSDNIGIKIDVEGFEGEVIKGLRDSAARVRFVMAEVSVLKRLKGAPDFGEFVSLMHERGFAFYNLMNSLSAVPPRYCDVLFLRRDDPRLSR